jgi:hypothetical protein
MNEVRSTVIYDDVATELSGQSEAGELWIWSGDLARATRFELKPRVSTQPNQETTSKPEHVWAPSGLCRGEVCYLLPQSLSMLSEFLRDESGKSWFNLTAFARLTGQPVAHDATHSTWYFGVRSDQRQILASLEAPDFTLPDIDGNLHSLSDFRGKKVFLVTWASW